MFPTNATQPDQTAGPASTIPPPLPRPPPPPNGRGSMTSPGHPPQHRQSLSAPFPPPPHPSQQAPGMVPGGPSYPMPPSPKGVPGNGGVPGRTHHNGPSSSPYHHPLHSPAQQPPQRQPHPRHHQGMPQHHHQQPVHPNQQTHPTSMEPPKRQSLLSHGSHHHQQQQQKAQGGSNSQSQASASQHFLPNGLNGDWQSDKDMQHRREMIQHIVKLLKQKDETTSREWLNKLPQMVKQLEVSLYRSAPSFEAYADTSTLKHRLQLLAMEIAKKTQQSKGDETDSARRGGPDQQHRQSGRFPGMNSSNSSANQRQGSHGVSFMGHPNNSQLPNSGLNSSQDPHQQLVNPRQSMANRGQRPQQRGSVSDRRQVVNVGDINPMICGDASNQNMPGSGNNNSQMAHSGNGNGNNPFMMNSSGNASTGNGTGIGRSSSSSMNMSSQQGMKDDPGWTIRIRHKQQRLLLLHHASKCPHDDGRCTVTDHCQDMKRLWKHMARCTDNNCRVSHCFSSRSILSHYRKCKDAACPACGPVRETVKRSPKGGGMASSRSIHKSGDPSQRGNSGGSLTSPMGNSGLSRGLSNGSLQVNSGGLSNSDSMAPTPLSLSAGTASPLHQTRPPQSGTPYAGNGISPSLAGAFGPGNGSLPGHGQQVSGNSMQSGGPGLFRPDQQRQGHPSMSSSGMRNMSGSGSASSDRSKMSGSGSRREEQQNDEWRSKIRHKQQRLLLLRHASKCPFENGQCKVTPHCASMKRLWKHISDCKDQHCKVQHCMSSRYVLSHYRRCKDARCPACGPVRETIKTTNQRSALAKEKMKKQTFNGGIDFDRENGQHQRVPSVDGSGAATMGNQQQQQQQQARPSSMQSSSDALQPVSKTFSNDSLSSPQEQPTKRAKSDGDSLSEEVKAAPVLSSTSAVEPSITTSQEKPAPILSGDQTQSMTELTKPDATDKKPPVDSKGKNLPPEKTESATTEATATVPAQAQAQAQAQPPKVSAPPVTSSSSSKPAPAVTSKSREDLSLINSFTVEEIETHIASLNRTVQLSPSKLKVRCLEILKGLQTHNHGWVFNCPVDPVELGLPDYFDIIKRPMDLGTIQKKLESGSYHSIEDFSSDVRLTFDNAMTYNEVGSVVHDMAKEVKSKFLGDHEKLIQQLKSEEEERRSNDRACTLCGCEKLLFEPPVFFCNSLNCPSKRIRRNCHFYVGGNNQYFWCNQCYGELEEGTQIELVDLSLKKGDLKKKKNDEVHEESWVQCDSCERWIHQICGLFNTRQNKEHKSEYCCPQCLLDKCKNDGREKRTKSKALLAADLPRTKLSEWLESNVRQAVEKRCGSLAKEKADSEGVSLEDAKKMTQMGGPITIRQVTSMDRKLEVRERMKRRYAHKNYPSEFPFRCKCIVVFQNLDGVDVILFALYVYEHGENNPPPNQRSVYISYLDSVHFMRPRRMRTFVYHEIMITYLDYARRKGFASAHIWACPPLKGDDYIFYAKPEDQKTPKDGRLRQWYVDMLVECQKRSIVGKLTNMYDLYFANEKLDATAVPYLEGDYFPGEAENIIKDLEEGRSGKSGSSGKKSKKKKNSSKSKSKSGRCGTRSGGIEDEAPANVVETNVATAQKDTLRDHVMVKLGETIHPMKESFIVAFLNWKGAKAENMVVPDEILRHREELKNKMVEDDCKADLSLSSTAFNDGRAESRKRDADGNIRTVSSGSSAGKDGSQHNGVKVIDDDLEELDYEFFNNRQAFLNLCRGNHYQFDELRRAKHTSMMVLWHLHNRDAPKFVQQCASCNREILAGIRYHCSTCTEFDLCEECFKNPNTNRGSCTHKLEPIRVEGESGQAGQSSGGSDLTEAQRKERQRNIQLHIQLIEHASRCNSPTCSSSNCAKMKSYLKHGSTCKLKASGGCKICKRIWTLLRIHSQHCKAQMCPIPQCMAIRARIRQLAKQQQAMDDRRRQEMNRHCRIGTQS